MAYALIFFFLGDLPETSVQIVKLVTYFLALIGRIRFAEFRIWIRVSFCETVHLVREAESGFANPASPVLTRIH